MPNQNTAVSHVCHCFCKCYNFNVQISLLFVNSTFYIINQISIIIPHPVRLVKLAPVAQVVECPLRGTGGHGFDPGPRHTKVGKNGMSCSSLGTQTYGVELGLDDLVSG